jgi:hypothetical protein
MALSKNIQIKKYWLRLVFLFYGLWVISVPSPNPKPFLNGISFYLAPFFERLARWSATDFFQIKMPLFPTFISDATILYIHVFNIFIVAAVMAFLWLFVKKISAKPLKVAITSRFSLLNNDNFLQYILTVLVRYYVALQMLVYGFSKVFKWQFYAPEPNILYTHLGHLSNDILYWSAMGGSRFYSVFGGCLELLVAVLLLFKRTQLVGALIGIGVLANVVAINFGYNISVKLYSIFLLFSCVYLVLLERKRLFSFFFEKEKTLPKNLWTPTWESDLQIRIYRTFKALVISLMLVNALFIYISTNNFNDDTAPRPIHHGAYEVDFFIENNDTIPPLLTDSTIWRRFFIHRKNYFIVQKMDDKMQDFELIDLSDNSLAFFNHQTNDTLRFSIFKNNNQFILKQNGLRIEASKIDLKALPFSKRSFDWTVDEFINDISR